MSAFRTIVTEDMRLAILQILSKARGHETNHHVLISALSEFGHRIGRDRLKTELKWLEEQGLLQLREVSSTWVAFLTAAGDDTAQGRSETPGVRPPPLP